MCGIFCSCRNKNIQITNKNKIKHRGPDNTTEVFIEDDILFLFHRLAINGLDTQSDQPYQLNGRWLICNGEIYNYKQLIEKYDFNYNSNSDCEIILHMYNKFGIERTLQELDGVFAFVIYDSGDIIAARDPIGIRSLFYCIDNADTKSYTFGSEAKCFQLTQSPKQFPVGSYFINGRIKEYFNFNFDININLNSEMVAEPTTEIFQNINSLLTQSVKKRLLSDRKICTLLSGGLDSSLITSLVAKNYKPFELDTYAIGLENSVDLKYARKAAEYLKTNHNEIIITEDVFLSAIEPTIYQIESYCTTTVRASVGNYLVSKFIRKNSDNVVVFCGDLSDELFGSYRGFCKAPNKAEFYKENIKMLKDVCYFDVLRSDKSISGAGLEARVPFADKEFVNYVMKLDPSLKMFGNNCIEKNILRKSFEGYLPNEILWRKKEAFSDGVSSENRNWFDIIKEYVNLKVTDEEFEQNKNKEEFTGVYDKESYYYKKIFNKYYPNCNEIIPYYWRHPFSQNVDPSARLLDCYNYDT